MKKIILSKKDYETFIEFCDKEPDPEQVAKLKKLFDKTTPWDEIRDYDIDGWEWDDE